MNTTKLAYLGNSTFVLPETRVRVTRTIVFEGPADWIAACLTRAWLEKGRPNDEPRNQALGEGKTATEISRVVEVL